VRAYFTYEQFKTLAALVKAFDAVYPQSSYVCIKRRNGEWGTLGWGRHEGINYDMIKLELSSEEIKDDRAPGLTKKE